MFTSNYLDHSYFRHSSSTFGEREQIIGVDKTELNLTREYAWKHKRELSSKFNSWVIRVEKNAYGLRATEIHNHVDVRFIYNQGGLKKSLCIP